MYGGLIVEPASIKHVDEIMKGAIRVLPSPDVPSHIVNSLSSMSVDPSLLGKSCHIPLHLGSSA